MYILAFEIIIIICQTENEKIIDHAMKIKIKRRTVCHKCNVNKKKI